MKKYILGLFVLGFILTSGKHAFATSSFVFTDVASSITSSSVLLNGHTTTNTVPTSNTNYYRFQYATSNSFSSLNNSEIQSSSYSYGAFSVSVNSLQPNTQYFYRAVLVSGDANDYGDILSFTTTASSGTQNKFARSLHIGLKGEDVKKLQEQLVSGGFLDKNTKVDGSFGPRTNKAIQAFQTSVNIPVTGVFDSATSTALVLKIKSTPASNRSTGVTNAINNSIHVFYVADGLALPSPTFAFLSGSGLSINPILKSVLGI